MPTAKTRAAVQRSHSRTSSASKIHVGLQLTQAPAKHELKIKKVAQENLHHVAPHPHGHPPPRVPSNVRVHQPTHAQLRPPHSGKSKHKTGFTIATEEDEEEVDDDDWVSSESGAATPAQREGDGAEADDDSSADSEEQQIVMHRPILPANGYGHTTANNASDRPDRTGAQTPVPRVATARQSDYSDAPATPGAMRPPAIRTVPNTPDLSEQQKTTSHSQATSADRSAPPSQVTSPTTPHAQATYPKRPSRPTPTKRLSSSSTTSARPMSIHSTMTTASSRHPHPLIRGGSYSVAAPLKPLTVAEAADAKSILSVSPPKQRPRSMFTLSSSPGSGMDSPTSPHPPAPPARRGGEDRRTSVSSVRTLPPSATYATGLASSSTRNRTLSTLSSLSSISSTSTSTTHGHGHHSAALHALTHPSSSSLLYPPKFFPSTNSNLGLGLGGRDGPGEKEPIHPLLPSPYLNNHLSVLLGGVPMGGGMGVTGGGGRSPIGDAWERVWKARESR